MFTKTVCLFVILYLPSFVMADESSLQATFDHKYADYFGSNSQSFLPFTSIEKPAWKTLQATRPLKVIFVEPEKYYVSKLYTLTMYQATDDGQYYLDVKGGFWGMDDLIYGPIQATELQ